ncbi:DUF3310 domain-containing protein [Streptomyces sp. NPDC051561]|uniref:DUF3310 domain-containing protein n=1 Tax=Streptomyces sp. NPDC051561 TaxID=3365658 RepID=UPI0037BA81B2
MKFTEGDQVWISQGGMLRRGRVKSVNEAPTVPYPYEVAWEADAGKITHASHVNADEISPADSDPVNSPSHYTWLPQGLEVIDLTEGLSFCLGNVVKYTLRAGRKSASTELEDLEKARWYVDREIDRLKKEKASG